MPVPAPSLGNLREVMQTPIARALARYWWVVVPIGLAAWVKYKERKEKDGKANWLDVAIDVSPLVGTLGVIVTINDLARQAEERERDRLAQAPRPRPAPLPAREADFQPVAQAVPSAQDE